MVKIPFWLLVAVIEQGIEEFGTTIRDFSNRDLLGHDEVWRKVVLEIECRCFSFVSPEVLVPGATSHSNKPVRRVLGWDSWFGTGWGESKFRLGYFFARDKCDYCYLGFWNEQRWRGALIGVEESGGWVFDQGKWWCDLEETGYPMR